MWRLVLLGVFAAFIYADYAYVSGKISSGAPSEALVGSAPCEHYSAAGTAPCFDGSYKPLDLSNLNGMNQRQPVIDGAPTAPPETSSDTPSPVSAGN